MSPNTYYREGLVMEEIAVFKIIKTCDSFGITKYEWTYFEKDCWVNSSNWFDTKGECLLNFILEKANLQIQGIDD